MIKCPYCGAANSGAFANCAECNSPLKGTKTIQELPKPTKKTRTRKAPEMVKLYHGPWVKKSTYNWLKKKESDQMQIILRFFGIMFLCAILQQCSG